MQLHARCPILRPKKLLHAVADDAYKQSLHELHETHKLAEEVCRYDLDHLDEIWLKSYNDIREQCGWWLKYSFIHGIIVVIVIAIIIIAIGFSSQPVIYESSNYYYYYCCCFVIVVVIIIIIIIVIIIINIINSINDVITLFIVLAYIIIILTS